jgi:hypothetical protein
VARVRINHLKVERVGNGLSKPLVQKVCRETKEMAQKWPRAGNPAYTYPPTGRLASEMFYRVRDRKSGPFGVVGNTAPYAEAVHNGTKGRWILARNHKVMKFRWKRFGGVLSYFPIVWHPPTKGSYFLTIPLRIVSARYGLKVRNTRPL